MHEDVEPNPWSVMSFVIRDFMEQQRLDAEAQLIKRHLVEVEDDEDAKISGAVVAGMLRTPSDRTDPEYLRIVTTQSFQNFILAVIAVNLVC